MESSCKVQILARMNMLLSSNRNRKLASQASNTSSSLVSSTIYGAVVERVKTPALQAGNAGSIPASATKGDYNGRKNREKDSSKRERSGMHDPHKRRKNVSDYAESG